jgi:RNA polymerase sigma-70 factor (family 1)
LCAIASGDERAFEELYACHFPMVYGYVLKLVKVPALAEDVVQDIFIKIWEARAKLTDVRHFPAFLFAVMRNHTLNVLHSVSRSQNATATLVRQFQEQRVDDEVLSKDYRHFIEKALQQVPARSRDIFRKCREQGLSYEEVAREIGISRNAVKNHMVGTIRVLREAAFKELGISLGLLLCFFY